MFKCAYTGKKLYLQADNHIVCNMRGRWGAYGPPLPALGSTLPTPKCCSCITRALYCSASCSQGCRLTPLLAELLSSLHFLFHNQFLLVFPFVRSYVVFGGLPAFVVFVLGIPLLFYRLLGHMRDYNVST